MLINPTECGFLPCALIRQSIGQTHSPSDILVYYLQSTESLVVITGIGHAEKWRRRTLAGSAAHSWVRLQGWEEPYL